MVKSSRGGGGGGGGGDIFCLLQISQTIDGFRQNNSQGFKNSKNSIYKQSPLDFFFHCKPKLKVLLLGFNNTWDLLSTVNMST